MDFLWRQYLPRHATVIALACLALFTTCGATAQIHSTWRPLSLDSTERKFEEVFDAIVPLITVEQVGDRQNLLQGYRVQLFKSGKIIYHGFREVKIIGEVVNTIDQEKIRLVLDEFDKYKF
ncbi:MAG: hypothetical protein EON54_04060 [Alcaligenaceae bacterium]|nr:MAG: hypothetical protein EON54_04060 [Alcaligenaceae bacterium]